MSPTPPSPVRSQAQGRLGVFSMALLAYNLGVVLWGAFVRATGSGAGCGSHWPLCNGEVVPRAPTTATLVELTHRLTSGLALVGVVVLLVAARRVYPERHRVRRAAAVTVALMVTEALLGAGLVLLEHVAHNPSEMRGVSVSLHLVNTFALLAALTATTFWANGGRGPWEPDAESAGSRAAGAPSSGAAASSFRPHRAVVAWLSPALLGVVLLGATGAIAALGDLLFPVQTLKEGLAQDVSPTAHLFVRLRLLHPALAVVVGAYAVFAAGILRALRPSRGVRLAARGVAVLFVIQMALGLANVTFLAPVPLQLLHLFFADVLWLTLVMLTLAALATAPRVGAPRGRAAHAGAPQVGERPSRSSASATSASPAREASATG